MKSPTLTDVAQRAGVSYATADRVVNDRGSVAEKSVRKVRAAVAELGYVRNVAAASLSRRKAQHIVFVLPAGDNAFFEHMRSIISAEKERLAPHRIVIEIAEVEAFSADPLCDLLERLQVDRVDGIAVVGLQSPKVASVLARLRTAGVAVVTFVSDAPDQRPADYIGVDNHKAGQTAARLIGFALGRQEARQVQVVVGSLKASDHRDRLAGFESVIATDYPNVEILAPIEGLDQGDRVAELLTARLDAVPSIVAIYSLGAGNSGLVRALEARDVRPFCVVHEVVPHSREALETGLIDVIIDQRPELEVAQAIGQLRAMIDQQPIPPAPRIVPTIFVRDNLPETDPTYPTQTND